MTRETAALTGRVQPERVAAWNAALTAASSCGTLRLLYGLVWKRWLDAVVALLLLIPVLPILGVAALAIRLDSRGTVLFRQTRVGRHGKPFIVWKLRTMAHTSKPELVLFEGADGKYHHKLENDPRVTRVGRILRRTSIDELPQLVNVLRGDMSLVGPRPELPQIVASYQPWQHRRHLVRPGLTGWWQVSGRSDRPMHENTELDIYYVDHLALRLDLAILWRTVRVVLSGSGAF